MSQTWIVVADSTRARILSPSETESTPLDEIIHFVGRTAYTGAEKMTEPPLQEEEALVFPKGHSKPQDIDTDAPGHAHGSGVSTSYETRHTDLDHQVAEEFSREIVDYLKKASQKRQFEELVLVAPPKFLGVLRQQLPRKLSDLVMLEIAKDYTTLSSKDLRDHLADQMTL